ncbi:Armadillo repeat containing protein [Oryctes borbonicus]|uniref:Transportin-1 n=1 Tax=Oryctes borbonicus TaxID=1629725 RepID=A0A0T6BER0_9SCAR|nr:Armadillo repeat containing protein [Oryctes borbonicus]
MSVGDWTPQEDAMSSVVDVLQESFVPNTEIQKNVHQKIALLQNYPNFIQYLLCILKKPDSFSEDIRALSGILLKNNLTTTYDALSIETVEHMKTIFLHLLKDGSRDVRSSATNLINVVLWKGGLSRWPDLLPTLIAMVDSSDIIASETALSALLKICEDYLANLQNSREPFDNSIKAVLGKFIDCVTNKYIVIRKNAMKILNESLQEHYEAIKQEFDTNLYLNKLLQVALDENSDIQKAACLGFVTYIENRDTVILPHMNNLIEYMLEKTQSDDSDLALQACEFWLACSKLPTCRNILMPYMEKLLPILLKNMRYSEYEINGLKDVLNDDDHIPDKEEDIKPFNMSDNSTNNLSEEENNFDLLDSLDEPSIGWTLRKCSAASLDALSGKFGDDMLPNFVPLLNEALNSEDTIIKESGILALGAIAEGCTNGLKPHLPDLINYLMKCMSDRNSLIRVITCWTLSRYMHFITSEEPHDAFFIPVMMVLLKHFLDNNKRVQRAALSAFCVFQEEAGFKLVPYIDVILQAFVEGFKQYKFRSFFLLYDAITVLAQAVGNNLNKPQYVEWLMPPLMYKFNTIEDYYDDQFLALTECLSSVTTALEIGFLPYAEVVFSKCLIVVNETVTACLNYNEGPDYLDPPDKEPICGAHDLLLAMAFGLKTYFVKFVTNSNLVQQLYYTMQDDMPLIRQPALALFGEIVKLCFPFINDQIHAYIPVVIENLDKRFDGACNNAAWVIGKLCLAMGKNIEPYLGQIFEHFVEILQSCNGSKAMYQTVAISLCTLGLVCPDEIAQQLGTILRPCCQAMRNVRDCDEKEIGFRGMCELVVRNPTALMTDFIYFCDAVASWNTIKPDVKEIIRNILLSIKQQCGEDWLVMYEQFPLMLRARLEVLYGV